MKCECTYWPGERERILFKRCIWVTMGRTDMPDKPASSELLKKVLRARHSPIRVLQFAFEFTDIPSNTATHFCRHVHSVPYVSSLRNDRQARIDGDAARRDTPVDMILYVNAEELMTIANKRLCAKAAPMTREATEMMCEAAIEKMPEIKDFLVPMCVYHGGVCHEIDGCGRCVEG